MYFYSTRQQLIADEILKPQNHHKKSLYPTDDDAYDDPRSIGPNIFQRKA